jgi:hypothetical protein
MTALSPRFTDNERLELAEVHGLTQQQLKKVERHLGVILDFLGPHDRMDDVRSELRALNTEMKAANARICRWAGATRPSPGAEAFGHLNIAGADYGSMQVSPGDGIWPEIVVPTELIQLLAGITQHANQHAPSRRRHPNPASPSAIACIVERLKSPTDAASQASASALFPSRTSHHKKTGPSFSGVAEIIFSAVYRALNVHRGNPDNPIPSPTASIRAYLDSLPVNERRRPGRPKKLPKPGTC